VIRWVRIREKEENQSAEARLLAVFEDIRFNERSREKYKPSSRSASEKLLDF